MEKVRTKSFELAVRTAGEPNSSKFALVMPGRLDTKDYANNISHVQYLSTLGYFALSFDPPGTWESPGDIQLYTTTNYIKVVNELVEMFGNKPTLLFGHSRGGTVAMLAGTANSYVTHIIAAMSYYGAPSAPTDKCKKNGWQSELRDLPPGLIKDSQNQKYFKLPLGYFEDGAGYNAAEAIKVSHKPKLFFYGTNDVETNPDDVKKMYQFAAEPKFLHELNSEHRYWRYLNIIKEINEVIGEFLDTTTN